VRDSSPKKEEFNPLTTGDLEGAAYLCLDASAWTDLNQFPPGLGDLKRRLHRERRKRFEQALQKMKNGVNSLFALGLSSEDCSWAASKADRAKNPEEWLSHFKAAEEALKKAVDEPTV
jgi:hypothetical protein